ncbi:MAG: hypothetical protein E7247_09740, partial [Paenibacillaceae bacterium]|nr:hypothetical protein [Paenibacillaceae bacterium]
MKGNVKRVICLFLAAIIVVTTVGYAPPSFALTAMSNSRMEEALKALASPSEAEEIVEEVATPSEAESPGDKATPSEAEKPGDKATPSEATRKFIQVEPEEIPEYYSQVRKAGKRFWKFEDRNGMIQYRDYGYVEGEAEFPLWYEADQAGSVEDMSSSVNLDKEYYSLAPYIFKSVTPGKTAWSDLSWKLLYNSDGIEAYTKEKISKFENWDSSDYYIWYLVNKGDEEEEDKDLGYHFYGTIVNEEESERQPDWYYSDENGNISKMNYQLMSSLLSVSNSFKFGMYYLTSSSLGSAVTQTVSRSEYSDNDYYKIPNPPAWAGHKFLGWASDLGAPYGGRSTIYSPGEGSYADMVINNIDVISNPQNYDYYFSRNNAPGSLIDFWDANVAADKGIKCSTLSQGSKYILGVYRPDGTYSIKLLAPNKYWGFNNDDENRNGIYYIIIKNEGEEIDLSKYPISYSMWIFGGWYSEPNGTGTKYDKFTLTEDTTLYAYMIDPNSSYTVTFQDWDGRLISSQNIAYGKSATAPANPMRVGYNFNGWDKTYDSITKNTVITAQYAVNGYSLILDGNGGTLEGKTRKEQVISFNQSYDQVLKDGRDLVSRLGYSFDGWYTSASGGSGYSYSGNQMPAANVTLFAHWSPNTYKVTFDPDHVRWDGEAIIEEHTFDTILGTTPPMPEIYGWKFTGWWTGKNGTGTEVT